MVNCIKMSGNLRAKVGVAFGGPSPEYDISVASAKNICRGLFEAGYDITPIHITKEGKFLIPSSPTPKIEMCESSFPMLPSEAAPFLQRFDVIFNAMHGPYGEDGMFQSFLSILGVPCTGSSAPACALAIDKMRSRMVMQAFGVPVPESVYLTLGQDLVPFMPAVIKPNAQGSSVGVTIVRDRSKLKEALDLAFSFGDIVVAEEYLEGKEITCSVLQRSHKKPEALPVTLIIPKTSEFFDIKAKYEMGASEEITPAPIEECWFKLAQQLAVMTHEAIGCSGVTRVDMFLLPNGTIKVLEINTLPGMTDTSLVPQAAKCVGISFPQLLTLIIQGALND